MRYLIALVSLALAISTAVAGTPLLQIEHAWARAMPKGTTNAVVYLTIVNSGTEADRLTGASCSVGASIQIHEATTEDGVAKMRQLTSLDVPPGSQVALKPSGVHLMLLGVSEQLKEGQTFPLTLTFEKAGTIEATVKVGKVGAMDDMSGM